MDNIPTKVYTIWDKGSGVRNTDKNYEAEGVWQLMDIEPIPLTAEILEKNGFVEHDNLWVYETIQISIDGDVRIKGCLLPIAITTVHELQHALRLCGLNDMADNFKV